MSRRMRVLVLTAFIASAVAGPAAAQSSVSIVTRPEGSVARAETWVRAVLAHEPGAHDSMVSTVAAWRRTEVEALLVELASIRALMRDPNRKVFEVPIELDGGRPKEIRYSGREREALDRTAGGVARAGLRDTDLVTRAIVLHTDVARLAGGTGDIFRFTDGQAMDREQSDADHWRMARSLADTLRTRDGRDADLLSWYRATTAYMASIQMWNAPHVRSALSRFEGDAQLQFVGGCLHERLAAPRTQATMAASRLPANTQLRVGSEGDELDEAASLLKRAVDRDPRHAEARLHYGRVLTLTGKAAAAVGELRRAATEVTEPELRYYAQLFLGAALEAARQPGAARTAYQAAAAIFPKAQSPRLALSALAAAEGDRDVAARAMVPLFELSDDDRQDPWVMYFVSCGRGGEELIADAARRLSAPLR